MRYSIYPLAKLIEEFGEGQVGSMLSSFACSKDRDRETYLREKAVMMEKKAMSRTYLAVSDEGSIVGYFSVGMKCMSVPDDIPISNSLRKKLNVNNESGVAQMYLLGQLARSDDSDPGMGSDLLDDALDIIHGAFVAVGCRVVRVDCADDLVQYYTRHGFTYINRNSSDDLNRLVTLLD